MIAALYVIKDGPYYNIDGIDPWDKVRDARRYKGPWKVICHSPCSRWGRYWGGGPMLHGTAKQKMLGDDDGCAAHALWSVRQFGGVFEHPEGSKVWDWFGLPRPGRSGGWSGPDSFGGYACCVAQGHYGHRAQKYTWLYAVRTLRPELKWGPITKTRIDPGYHSKEKALAARAAAGYEPIKRLSEYERMSTPKKFRDLLIRLVSDGDSDAG